MTKSQCYAEIAQKQSEIANYNTKIEKLNSEKQYQFASGIFFGV